MVGILVLWTITVFRLISFRTTLGSRTLVTFGALGALLGTAGTPVVEKFFNSYRYDGNQLYVVLIIAAQHLLMAAPILLLLMRPAWRRGSSLGDAFLAAFAIGAGYEFLGVWMASATAPNAASGLSFLPPGTASAATVTVAGYAYWTALLALTCATALRFLRNAVLAYAVTAVALVACVLDHYGDLFDGPTAQAVGSYTLHGNVLPWIAIVFLAAAVFLETRWTKSKGAVRDAIAEFQAVAVALVTFKWNEAKLAGARWRLKRQREILAAESQRELGQTSTKRQAESIRNSLTRMATVTPAPQGRVLDWLKRRWTQLLGVVAFLCLGVFFFMPDLGSFSSWVWSSLPMATRLAPFQLTLVVSILIGVLAWQFVKAPRQAFSSSITDEVARFWAERRILQAAIGVVLVALLYPHPEEFAAFESNLARAAGLQIPGFNETQKLTLLVLLAWAVSGVTARRAEIWRKTAGVNYLQSLARNFISLCGITLVAWLSITFFTEAQVYAHANWGANFFNRFQSNGNSILEMTLGLVTVVFSFGVALAARLTGARFEKRLMGADGGA
jgi:hypothetical protein